MGTDWSLQAVAPPPNAAQGVQAALDLVVAQMSQWEPGSHLSRFNRAAPGTWLDIPPEMTKVVDASLTISRESGGAFDPCLGQLTERWGFGSTGPIRTPPTEEGPPGVGSIELDASARRIRRTAAAALDLSGIAKGYGVDLAAEWLLANGVRHFLIEVGGELRGEGLRPDGQPWWVDVETPPLWSAPSFRIALHDVSVATSGNYRRGFTSGGQDYSHSFDPATGRPIVHGVRSVTVLHRSCIMADGWATALTVMGPQDGIALADAQRLAVCMMAGNREYLSDGWHEMMA